LLQMATVKRLTPRLACFQTKLTFTPRLQDASEQVRAVRAAVRSVRDSRTLHELLGMVLSLGNFLNAGSARANAQGFESEVLLKLGETKSTVSDKFPTQTSLLHYLARCAVVATPDAQKKLKHELRALEDAATIASAEVKSEVESISKELDGIKNELQYHQEGSASEADQFHTIMSKYHASALTQVDDTRRAVESMSSDLEQLTVFLGEPPGKSEPEQLLSRINAFAVSFCKACRDNDRAEHLRKKQEQAKAERVQKENAKEAAGQSRPLPLHKKPTAAASHMMSSIQGSLRRGEFAQMKALHAQMSSELQSRIGQRRKSSNLDSDEVSRRL